MNIQEYLDEVRAKFASGQATEHSYRPALQKLFESIDPALTVINEPKKSEAGMPDFLFQRGDIPQGWCEAKDVDKDVIKLKGYSIEQRKRYEKAYPNLIYTNGVDFEFIREGEPVHFVSIADFLMGLQPRPERFDELKRQLRTFAEQKPISIRSAAKLAEIMAAKAAIIKDEIGIALDADPHFRSALGGQFKSFKANLLPALTPDEFADIYAETITYGLFAARFHDDDLSTFSRQEALEKLPASNPFLKGLFEYIAGPALPKRLEYIVDDLVQVMRASDPHSLFEKYGKFTARNDPFVHFYEDFLAAYNPKKRKSRGVWYTPEPVVDFIVRAVDDVLKIEFGLADGLADTSKVTVDWDTGQNDKKGQPVTIKKEVHKVQILDPATGTGTFLAKAVQLIADRIKNRAPGKWSGYVEQDLLPRLHGFELLMASYAMCHMKLDMQLTQSGYRPSAKPPRLSVWLTNSLEPAEREVKDLFFQPLAEEARGASEVKRQTPIMCVIGNPPYSGHSSNKGRWIDDLINVYRTEPGGIRRLEERSFKYINDDYVKFIRLAETTIDRNDSGILAMITNHGYIDNPTFRGMRWHLLKSFSSLYIFELNGSAKRVGVSPANDENVFDIQQGVAIIVGVRRAKHKPATNVWYSAVEGTRQQKNNVLFSASISNNGWTEVVPEEATFYSFAPFRGAVRPEYAAAPRVRNMFILSSIAMQTGADTRFVAESSAGLADALQLDDAASRTMIRPFAYRPFDRRTVFYAPSAEAAKTAGVIVPGSYRPRYDVLHHMQRKNMALLVPRQLAAEGFHHAFIATDLPEMCVISSKTKEQNVALPLYQYDLSDGQFDAFAQKGRQINFDPKVYTAFCTAAGIDPDAQAKPEDDFRCPIGEARPSEVKVFDYIYGVLHSPDYRTTYAEFLKIDFPRIPYPRSPQVFRHVSEKGEQLRRLHLMEAPAIGDTPYPYHGEGDDIVASGYPKFEGGKVQINPDQHFADVPEIAWSFHIGGYQPAQKWLKDRRGRLLSYDDIGHYQKIVKILFETDRIMKQIELPLE